MDGELMDRALNVGLWLRSEERVGIGYAIKERQWVDFATGPPTTETTEPRGHGLGGVPFWR